MNSVDSRHKSAIPAHAPDVQNSKFSAHVSFNQIILMISKDKNVVAIGNFDGAHMNELAASSASLVAHDLPHIPGDKKTVVKNGLLPEALSHEARVDLVILNLSELELGQLGPLLDDIKQVLATDAILAIMGDFESDGSKQKSAASFPSGEAESATPLFTLLHDRFPHWGCYVSEKVSGIALNALFEQGAGASGVVLGTRSGGRSAIPIILASKTPLKSVLSNIQKDIEDSWHDSMQFFLSQQCREAGTQLSAVGAGEVHEADMSSAKLAEEYALYRTTIENSRSWRVTKPLRLARRLPSRIRDLTRHYVLQILNGGMARAIYHRLPAPVARFIIPVVHFIRDWKTFIFESSANVRALNELAFEAQLASRVAHLPMLVLLEDKALPTVDISIVTYNSSKWVPDFIQSLKGLDYPLEKLKIYFVDNSSQDDTLAALESAVSELAGCGVAASVSSRPNLGFGAGHNFGIGSGSSDYCLVTNIDLVFETASMRRIVSHAISDDPLAAAWEFRQKPYEHPKNYDPVSGATLWNSHACVLLRRSAFEKVGGYCDDLFMYGEDVELSYRLRADGFKLRYNPHAVVYHYTYETANEIKPLQLTGSTFANLYIRLSYGTAMDMLAVPLMAIWLLGRERFPGARRKHVSDLMRLLKLAPKLIATNRRRGTKAAFPFRGWDYDLIRKGAFHELHPPLSEQSKVTVITRSYKGRENILLQAMISVANQTYGNIQHIITEDRGEHLKDVVNAFAKSTGRDVIHVSGNSIGRSDAGNLALDAAIGKWCVFLDDDDLFYLDHLEVLVRAITANPGSRASYALAFDVPTRKDHPDWSAYTVGIPVSHAFMANELDYEILKHRNLLPIQVVLFERSLYEERAGFDEDLETLEDWALWQRFAYKSKFTYVPKTTSLYRTPLDNAHFNDRSGKFIEAYNGVVRRLERWREEYDRTMRP